MSGLQYAALSDQGRVRSTNEDRWFADPLQGLFIVADGMGGGPHGALAAEIVVQTLPKLLQSKLCASNVHSSMEVESAVKSSLVDLSRHLRSQTRNDPGLDGMGSTVVLLMVRGDQAIVAHLGDSRAYLLRDSELQLLTTDHSLLQALIAHGDLTPDEIVNMDHHPAQGQLTRYIGMDGTVLPEVRRLDLLPNDRLLLCSDGLYGILSGDRIATLLSLDVPLQQLNQSLVIAANQAGGKDNITAVVVGIHP